jgi:uncharacterized protein (TIGR03790 family)
MRWVLGWAMVLPLAAVARAELKPDEVAVIAMAESDQSRRLAEYYADARAVPKSQIFLLEGKPEKTMSRQRWEQQARPAIRAWLREDDRHLRIRCLVTTWDVPLRIAKRSQDAPVVVARQDYLTRSRASLMERSWALLKELDCLALEGQPPERVALDGEAEVGMLTAAFDAAFRAAQERRNGLKTEDDKKRAGATIERAFVVGGGISGLLRVVARENEPDNLKPQTAQQLELLKGRLQGLQEGLQVLASMPDSVTRDMLMLRLIPKTNGLVGAIQWIDEQRELLRKNETQASFDSELSLVGWPDYPLFRWQPNPLYYRYDEVAEVRLKTLMVSRLEAPTFELAKKLVDTAIAVEKTGLVGKVYLDARGMKFNPKTGKPGSYSAYDQSLRDLAERLRRHTKLEVVLNDEAKLFQEGDCPEAALYCGWYSLARYVDAFDWQPGAVGYHLASSEATTLRKPGSKVWCNAMLEDGICATLGPVGEPYLASFPLPDDFFSLLLTGRYTLAEVYYRTKPFNSWAMVLVGDPLYNPFKHKPPLAEDALPERLKTAGTDQTQQ